MADFRGWRKAQSTLFNGGFSFDGIDARPRQEDPVTSESQTP
jgi:hypothetical protein